MPAELELRAVVGHVFEGSPVFDRIGGPLLGVFPLISMFLVTSITMLRERTTGTLERLMTMPGELPSAVRAQPSGTRLTLKASSKTDR